MRNAKRKKKKKVQKESREKNRVRKCREKLSGETSKKVE